MNVFCNIIHKQQAKTIELLNASLSEKDGFYKALYDHELKTKSLIDNRDLSVKLFIYNFAVNAYNKKPKHKFMHIRQIFDNPFISDYVKEKFLLAICDAQRIYNILNRWVYKYKYKRLTPHNDVDLYMNPITEFQRHVMPVFQNGHKYLFAINDIVNLVENALCHMESYKTTPKIAKNPYNNVPFSKAILCNLYIFLSKRFSRVPLLIQQYFYCGLNLTTFRNTQEYIIRDVFVEKYMRSCKNDYEKMSRHITDLLKEVNYYGKILIDSEFPRDNLLKIMYPYVEIYMKYMYAFSNELALFYMRELRKKLVALYAHNPNFGRRMVNNITKKVFISEDHPKFMCVSYFRNFNNSHLQVIDTPLRYTSMSGTENYEDDEDAEDEEIYNAEMAADP